MHRFSSDPRREDCLAYAVLQDPDAWLGLASPTALQVFLAGVAMRAATNEPAVPSWRIYGPLQDPAFEKRLVARTGHPRLSIGWATALEFIHFSMADALADLKQHFEEQCEAHWSREPVGRSVHPSFWPSLAKRPGMFLGGETGWHLAWYLAGLTRGGDWLGLPEFARANEISDAIHKKSEQFYGTKFAGFRVPSPGGVQRLLAWADVEP